MFSFHYVFIKTCNTISKIDQKKILSVHCKKCFSYLDFLSCLGLNYILNQEVFSRQVKIIVLFSEKTSQKISEFLLETSKIICQWGKKNYFVFCLT